MNTTAYWISQVIIVIAYITLGIGLSKEKRLQILTYSSIYQVLAIVHYALLFGVMGIVASVISLFRNFLFIYNEKKGKNNPAWILILFSVIAVILTIIFYKSPTDILPCILTLIGIFSYWCRNTKITRVGNLFISGCYIAYAITLQSWFSIACELILVVFTTFGYFKHERKPKKN